MNTVAHPAARPASTSRLPIADHEALLEIDAEFAGRLKDHSGFGLAALACFALPVKAGLYRVDRQVARHDFMHRIHFRSSDQSVPHVRLVRDHC